MVKIDLGSGRQAMEVPDYIHVDKWAGDHIEYVHDLESGLPKFEANSVDEIRAHHCLEHISNLIPLMDDCWDALKPDGIFHIYVPNGHHVRAAYSDPTHVRTFVPETFRYFTHETLAAYPYTKKEWRIHDGYPKVNGSEGDWWEIEAILSPVKS